jgi:hypothetical protein
MNLLVIVIGKSIRQDWIEQTSELGRIDFFFAHRITTRNGTNDSIIFVGNTCRKEFLSLEVFLFMLIGNKIYSGKRVGFN